jgi:hypothetical protein
VTQLFTMTSPYRALCTELLVIEDALSGGNVQLSSQGQALDGYAALAAFRYVADKARILLVQQESEAPTDEELLRIAASAIEPYESSGIAPGEYEPETECAIEVYGSELITFARAVLVRYGKSTSNFTKA